jgi:hypothetical protein
MAYCCEIDRQNRIMVVSFEGEFTEPVMRAYYTAGRALYAGMAAPAAIIYDLSAVTAFQVTSDTVHLFAASSPHFPDPVLRFIVAPRDHVYGMARMFQTLGEGSRKELHVVRSRRAAIQQLGFAELKLERLAASSAAASGGNGEGAVT